MTRWMNGGEIERLAMVTNGDYAQCRSDTPKKPAGQRQDREWGNRKHLHTGGLARQDPGGLSAGQLVVISSRRAWAR